VEPVGDRSLADTGSGQDRLQALTTVGECGHCRGGGSADRLKASPDQRRDVRISLRDSTEYLPPTIGRLDIADANFEVSFSIVAAADERRVQGDGNRRRRGWRLDCGGVTKLPTKFKRMGTQGLVTLPRLHRQQMDEYASGDAIGHEGRKMRPQLVQFRRRPTMRRPADTTLGVTAAGAAKSREPHRHRAEQRRNLMNPPVLDVAPATAGRAVRPNQRMVLGLRGDHRPLHPCQKLLRLGQCQAQVRDIAKIAGPTDLQHVDIQYRVIRSRLDQTQNPSHPRSSQPTTIRPVISLPSSYPQILDTPAVRLKQA
jgi:hypothetical protein